MPTRSILYHAFGPGTMECTRCDFSAGATALSVHPPKERLRCSNCGNQGHIIYTGRRQGGLSVSEEFWFSSHRTTFA